MSNTEPVNPKRIGLFPGGLRHLKVPGTGGCFVFYDRMTPVILGRCEDVTLKGFSIDWDIPVLAQATVERVEDKSFDLAIETAQFPYAIEDNRLLFTGEGWKGSIFGHI